MGPAQPGPPSLIFTYKLISLFSHTSQEWSVMHLLKNIHEFTSKLGKNVVPTYK